jgi:hypothetical protein
MTVGYYEADMLAEQVLAELLTTGRFPPNVLGVDIHAEEMENEDGEAYTHIWFSHPVNDRKDLIVQLEFYNTGYRIISWHLINTTDWTFTQPAIFQGSGFGS